MLLVQTPHPPQILRIRENDIAISQASPAIVNTFPSQSSFPNEFAPKAHMHTDLPNRIYEQSRIEIVRLTFSFNLSKYFLSLSPRSTFPSFELGVENILPLLSWNCDGGTLAASHVSLWRRELEAELADARRALVLDCVAVEGRGAARI